MMIQYDYVIYRPITTYGYTVMYRKSKTNTTFAGFLYNKGHATIALVKLPNLQYAFKL